MKAESGEEPAGPNRREVLAAAARALLGVTVVGVATPVLEACSGLSPTAVPTSTVFDVSGLTMDGQALVTRDNGPDGAPVLIVRQAAGEFLALSMRCTHLGCTVGSPHNGVLTCPCHGAQYNLSGQVLRGPAPRSLSRYTVTYDPQTETVTLNG